MPRRLRRSAAEAELPVATEAPPAEPAAPADVQPEAPQTPAEMPPQDPQTRPEAPQAPTEMPSQDRSAPAEPPPPAPAPPTAGGPVSLGSLDEGRRAAALARLSELRDRASGLIHGIRLRAAGIGAAIGHHWRGLPEIARQRIAAGAILALLAVIVIWVLIPAAPCGTPGGDACPAEDHAIALVPGDALAYAHVDIDSDGEQLAAASAYGRRLPLLSGLLIGSVAGIGGEPVDFASQIAPWAGDEAAVAVLPGPPSLAPVTMIAAADEAAAREFAAGLLGPARSEEMGGVDVTVARDGEAAAIVDGFLVIGGRAGVERIVEGDGAGDLATAAVAAGLGELPADRFAYAYVSGDGARSLFGGGGGLSTFDTFVNSRASSAVVAALSFEGGLASLAVRSTQNPDLAGAQPSFFSALPRFTPTLDADVGPDALAYLGLGDPSEGVEALLGRARRAAPALADAFERAAEGLREAGGVSVTGDLLPLLGSEAALSIEPVAAAGEPSAPGVLVPAGVPYVSLIADGVDADAAAADLAELQKPLAKALAPDSDGFEPVQIAGVEAQALEVSDNVELTYATYGDRLVVATKPIGIAGARAGGDGLASASAYRAVTAGLPGEVSMIAYLDLRDLLALGEQAGLATDPAYVQLAPDLRMLEAAALAVDDDGAAIRTDFSLSLGEPEDAAPTATPDGE